MKMDIKNMVRDFASLGEAKKRSSVYVKAVSLLCAAIVALVLFFMNMTVRGVTDRILVVNTGGEFLQLKSMETDKLYETLLKAHCNAVAYYVNSFDRMSISGNQAQAVFLVEKSELNAIWNKYLNDRAYADAADRGVIYKCVFEIIIKFYDEYVKEVRIHMEHENKNVFRYVEQLLKGHLCNNYNIGIFASKHNDIDPKLKDLKDIIIRYYPQKDNELLNSVLYDIINYEHDLYFHCLIEEHLFIPEVMDLEERLKKDSEIREIEIEDYEEKQEKLNKAALLSEREKGVVACIAQGMSNKEIAEQLCLSVNTVTTHRRNISMKLGIHSAASITIFAIVNKIVEIPGKS